MHALRVQRLASRSTAPAVPNKRPSSNKRWSHLTTDYNISNPPRLCSAKSRSCMLSRSISSTINQIRKSNFRRFDMAISHNRGTALHCACESNNEDLVQMLLDEGNPVDCRDYSGCTPLFTAVRAGSSNNILTLLVQRGAEVDALGSFGSYTPLAIAAGMGDIRMVTFLAGVGANLNVSPVDANGETPLHLAAMNGATAVTCFLLAAGCWPGVRDKEGKTPLSYACSLGREGTVSALLSGEGWALPHVPQALPREVTSEIMSFLVASPNAADYCGDTPLFAACEHRGTTGVLDLLAASGADFQARNQLGETALHVACRRGRADLVLYFLGGAGQAAQTRAGTKGRHKGEKDPLPNGFSHARDARGRRPGDVQDIDVGAHETLAVAEVLLGHMSGGVVKTSWGGQASDTT